MEKEKTSNLILSVLGLILFLFILTQVKYEKKLETMTINTPVNIFYVTESKLLFQTKSGLDTVFSSKEALYRYIDLATAKDSNFKFK